MRVGGFTRDRTLLRRFALALLRASGRPIVTRLEPWRVWIDPRDRWVSSEIFVHGSWEPFLMAVVAELPFTGTTAFDVGANLGVYSLALSTRFARVIALEPEPRSAALLERTLRSNSISNVELHRVAASNATGEATLFADDANRGNHSLHRSAQRTGAQTQVPTTTIDTIAEPLPDGEVGFAKIDVQWHELNVIRGMMKTIERNPEMILQIEAEGRAAALLVDELHRLGFRGIDVLPRRFVPLQPPETYLNMFGDHSDLLLTRSPNVHERLIETAARVGEAIRDLL